ncbi:MAG: hypothetical protein RBS36_00195 [Thiomicrospira sp.]|jgi:hypothetical protein|nr:hypothetical protein [Thiomicrospira sp.]
MYKQLIKAKLIKSLPASVKAVSSTHKLLHASLLAGVCFYEDDAGLEYIQFFDSVFFVLSRGADAQAVESKFRTQANRLQSLSKEFCFYQASGDQDEEVISQTLRGSKSLKLHDGNCFASEDVKAVFAEKGAWVYSKKGNKHFDRFVLLYLLAQSYNLHSERQLEKVANAYDSKQLSKMRDLKESALAFDVKYYFSNPVLSDRHQGRQIWCLLAGLFEVAQLHDEVKSQIQDLSDAITSQLQTLQEQRYKRWESAFWVFGALVGLIALF